MKFTITFTSESLAYDLSNVLDKKITPEMIDEHADQISDYLQNFKDNLLHDFLWEDFSAVAAEWGIPFAD